MSVKKLKPVEAGDGSYGGMVLHAFDQLEAKVQDDVLDDWELETILVIARNRQSGRITEYEIKQLVAGYKAWRANANRT